MSALPELPLHEPPPEEPLRESRWQGVVRGVAAAVGILVILLVVAVFVLLHNARFHRLMLRIAQEQAEAALGTPVQARDYALHWSGISPRVDLYDVVVYGAAPYANPPLLQADHLGVAVTVASLLHRTWYLRDVQADHPVLRVFVDRNGRDNLPQTKSSSQSHTSVFDLAVRHVLLDRGEVYYNNRKSVLSADLHELLFQSAFDTSQRRYSGKISYRDGHLQLGNYNPVPHDLQAQFEATPTEFKLHHAVLASGPSQFVLDATLDNYSQPRAQGTYGLVLDTGEFRRILKDNSLPSGVIRMAGSLQYQSQPTRPMLETLTVTGALNSRGLQVQRGTIRTQISDIAGRYRLSGGNLVIPELRARLLGGQLTSSLTMRNIAGASSSHLKATVSGLSLADLKTVMNSASLQQVRLNGVMQGNVDATWGKTMDNLLARADATIQANAGPAAPAKTAGKPNSVPVNSVIHARYSAAGKQLTLTQSYVQLPQTSLTLDGTVSNHSSLQLRAQSANLHELETVADMFRTTKPGETLQPLGLYGTGAFTGTVRGTTTAPQLNGQLTVTDLRVRGSSWRLLRSNIALSPSSASLRNGELDAAQRGRISFNLSAGLSRWSLRETSPFQAMLNVSQLNAGDLAKLAGLSTPVTGSLSAHVAAHGSEINPVGKGRITLTRATVSQQPIQSADMNFQGTGKEVHATISAHLPAGTAQGELNYFPRQQGYRAQLQAVGIKLEQLQAMKAHNLQGVLNLRASGEGTLKDPQITASLDVPQLKIQNQTINGISLQASVAKHIGQFALNSQVANTYIRSQGRVNLTDAYYAEAMLDTQLIPIQALVAAYAPAQADNITGQTEVHATLKGPLKEVSKLDAHLSVPTLQVNYKNTVQIGAAGPVRLDYTNGVLGLQHAVLRGTDTDLEFEGRVPIKNPGPMSLLMLGRVDLRLAQLINPDISSSGEVRFDINSFGNRANPNVHGQVRIVNANLASGDLPLGLQNGDGVLTLTTDRLEVTRFQGTVGGGTVTASGGIVYRPGINFDLAMEARGVRMLYPEGMRETVNSNLALTGTTQAARLGGQVRIENLSFTPEFDLNNFIGQFTGETTPAPPGGFEQNLQLDIGVQSSGAVNLSSRTLSLGGNANLRVTGTAADPVILGRVNLTGGDLIFNGNRYVLQGGTVDFVNPSQTQPNMNVTVSTTVQQYNVKLQFQGTVDHLHTNYSSDPALPPSDIINLLAFGKTSEAAAANPTPGNLGAQSLVASQVSSQVTNRVEKIAGISHLSVDPLLGCDQHSQGACVTVQQRVTGQIFVTFSTDVTSVQNQTIQLQYQATPRVSVSGTRDQNGGFGFDTRIKKEW